MCSGNDTGNFVMQNTLWCGSLYRQNISILAFHCQLMLVFGDNVPRPRHLGRECREFKSTFASVMKIKPFSPADQECVNTVQVLELVLGKHQDTIKDLSFALESDL